MHHHILALSRAAATLASHTADVLLPRACAACAQALTRGEHRAGWCDPCLAAVGRPVSRCLQCAIEHAGPSCESCQLRPPPFSRTLVLGAYAPPLDRIVRAFKFGRQPALGAALAAALAPIVQHELAKCPAGPLSPVVVAVPLSEERLAERGYNQSLLIARPLARALGLHVDLSALSRLRAGPPQSRLSPGARASNVDQAFSAAPYPHQRPVLLVDDVMTTGATLAAASHALIRAGAPSVTCVIVARTATPDVSRCPGPA